MAGRNPFEIEPMRTPNGHDQEEFESLIHEVNDREEEEVDTNHETGDYYYNNNHRHWDSSNGGGGGASSSLSRDTLKRQRRPTLSMTKSHRPVVYLTVFTLLLVTIVLFALQPSSSSLSSSSLSSTVVSPAVPSSPPAVSTTTTTTTTTSDPDEGGEEEAQPDKEITTTTTTTIPDDNDNDQKDNTLVEVATTPPEKEDITMASNSSTVKEEEEKETTTSSAAVSSSTEEQKEEATLPEAETSESDSTSDSDSSTSSIVPDQGESIPPSPPLSPAQEEEEEETETTNAAADETIPDDPAAELPPVVKEELEPPSETNNDNNNEKEEEEEETSPVTTPPDGSTATAAGAADEVEPVASSTETNEETTTTTTTTTPVDNALETIPEPTTISAADEAVSSSTNAEESAPTDSNNDNSDNNNPLAVIPPGFKRPERQLSPSYVPRGQQPVPAPTLAQYAKQYGTWTLEPHASMLYNMGENDIYDNYPHRDIPYADLPATSWQKDTAYLEQFLTQGLALADRALEAILTEYGHGTQHQPGVDFATRADMFTMTMVNVTVDKPAWIKTYDNGGWTTEASVQGLVRRILHAIMTEDTFTFVMGGHSAAAGHGNHYQQSYTLQAQKIMEPVFARLGVHCTSHNFGMGGLGTSMNSLGAGDIYGKEIDLLLWDSGMTERGIEQVDAFFRQTSLAGNRVPVAWGGNRDLLKMYHLQYGVDIGEIGNGMRGIPVGESMEQQEKLPWAARFMNCPPAMGEICNREKFRATCWIPRDDVQPRTNQLSHLASQVKWHPGFRTHQIQGRIIAFNVIKAVKAALTMWKEAPGYVLPDEAWHVHSYYADIQTKIMASGGSHCIRMEIPDSFCLFPVHGRTEFTPRHDPAGTSLLSIVKTGGYIPTYDANLYDPPDVTIPHLRVPDGEVDVLHIIENGIPFAPIRGRIKAINKYLSPRPRNPNLDKPIIKPGQGMGLHAQSASDNCDGTFDTFCGRSASSNCLLMQHNDCRGALTMDSFTGWVVMNLENVEHGAIVLKIETWHLKGENQRTNGWLCENNENCPDAGAGGGRQRRGLGGNTTTTTITLNTSVGGIGNKINSTDGRNGGKAMLSPWSDPLGEAEASSLRRRRLDLCDTFKFHFAIDGKITTWDKQEFESRNKELQRNVNVWTLVDDPKLTGGKKKDVELAVRMEGCERLTTFYLTHVYWH